MLVNLKNNFNHWPYLQYQSTITNLFVSKRNLKQKKNEKQKDSEMVMSFRQGKLNRTYDERDLNLFLVIVLNFQFNPIL